jgi:hypothetical protein
LLQVTGQSLESKVSWIEKKNFLREPADAFSVMYARLAILRPFIVAEANRSVSATASAINIPKSSLSIQNTLYKDLCTLCVSTAHDALEDLHCQLFSVYRSSPWHALYCKVLVDSHFHNVEDDL